MEVAIPQNCSVRIEGGYLIVKAGSEEHKIHFDSKKIRVEIKDGSVAMVSIKKQRRKTHAMINSIRKHLTNMFGGGSVVYQKKLSVIYAHFPVSIEVKGKAIQIKNFLGEKVPREAVIVGNTQVQVSGQEINVKGSNKEEVGQTAANIVQAVRIVGKDRRVFQDGIYLIKE
ncbi:MAG: 50S ribosomal protein L6 [Candidatus Micrarchaeota archaeon]